MHGPRKSEVNTSKDAAAVVTTPPQTVAPVVKAPERAASDHAMQAIDNLAGQITGNPQYFWLGSASAGGNHMAYERGIEKEAKRLRLMGVRIPVVAIRIAGRVA